MKHLLRFVYGQASAEQATVLKAMPDHALELRDLDVALGDGDLGITVGEGSKAAREAVPRNPALPPAELLRRAGAAFAQANPSTSAALVGGAVVTAAVAIRDDGLDPAAAVRFAGAVLRHVQERGGAEPAARG